MAKLIVLKGLPASGKSVYAAQLVQQGYVRVNKDDLRVSIFNGQYSKDNEAFINSIAESIIAQALQANLNVISDNTNLNPYHLKFAKAICRDTRTELEVLHINTPLATCLQRDLARTHGRVGRDVILKIYNKYYKEGTLIED